MPSLEGGELELVFASGGRAQGLSDLGEQCLLSSDGEIIGLKVSAAGNRSGVRHL